MKYKVEFSPDYSDGEWYTELVEADSEGEAMELVGCHLIDNGESRDCKGTRVPCKKI